jgi:glycosyltransferase involved in cell wall biosynthesis
MASLDVLVLPSLTTRDCSEQFGRVIAEAMASGVPVIASDSGSIPETVGDAGVIVHEGATAEFASALRQVSQNPAYHHSLSEAGVARAQVAFSPVIGAESLIAFWETVVNGPTM